MKDCNNETEDRKADKVLSALVSVSRSIIQLIFICITAVIFWAGSAADDSRERCRTIRRLPISLATTTIEVTCRQCTTTLTIITDHHHHFLSMLTTAIARMLDGTTITEESCSTATADRPIIIWMTANTITITALKIILMTDILLVVTIITTTATTTTI